MQMQPGEQQEQQQEQQQQQQQEAKGEDVWSKYPEELHMAILKRLPWMDKLRLRRVCVLWNSILRDPSLLRSSRPPLGSVAPFCCLNPHNHGGEFQLYSPLGRSWQTFCSSANFKVIAAAAGLLLMEGGGGGGSGSGGSGGGGSKRTLILLNPLNRSQRQLGLPPELEGMALQQQSCVFEMTLDGETDSIRILAGVWYETDETHVRHPHHRHWHGWKFYVYSLASDSWRVVADLCLRDEGNPVFSLVEQLPSVTIVGTDLYLLSTFHGTSSHLYRVRAMQEQQPETVTTTTTTDGTKLGPEQDLVVGGAPLPPSSSYVESKLFESEGRLVLILRQKFRVGKADDFLNNFWELSMYEFDFASSEWRVVLDLPRPLARSRSFVSFDIDGSFVCFHNDELTGICHIGSKTWTRLPSPVIRAKSRHPPLAKIFLFEPRIDIVL